MPSGSSRVVRRPRRVAGAKRKAKQAGTLPAADPGPDLLAQLDAARDVAARCARSAFAFRVNLVGYWLEAKRKAADGDTLRCFQERAAAMFETLAQLHAEAERIISPEILDSLALANAAAGTLPTVTIGGRRFATYHQAAVEWIHELLMVPILAADALCTAFDALETHKNGWGGLPAAVAGYNEPDACEFWERVCNHVRALGLGNSEDFEARITQEWGHARARAEGSIVVVREKPPAQQSVSSDGELESSADSSADKSTRFRSPLPEDRELRTLVLEVSSQEGNPPEQRRSIIVLAREITGETLCDDDRAQALTRAFRRYRKANGIADSAGPS